MVGRLASLRRRGIRLAQATLLLLAIDLLAPWCPAEEASALNRADIARLIERIRENESLFADLDATVRISCIYNAGVPGQVAAAFANPSPIKSQEEVDRISTRGERYFFSGEEVTSYSTGEKTTVRRVATYDGSQTVAIEGDNSATTYRGRYEPSQMFPPLCWGLFTQQVNFPLSVYLEGTKAIKAHPKPRRYPSEKGSVFEFGKVEVEQIGDEKLGDLDCVNVKLRRWYYTSDPAVIEYLWLVKDRNYHVACCRTFFLNKRKEEPHDETRVTKWQEVGHGVWLPAEVTSESYWGSPGKKPSKPWFTRQLTLEKAALGTKLPAESFPLPRIPNSLPKFVIGADGRLEDDPQHLEPAQADPGTTLDSILTRLAAEEARYDPSEVATTVRYRLLNPSLQQGGLTSAMVTTQRSLFAGSRMFFTEDAQSRSLGGQTFSQTIRRCYDGRLMRETYSNSQGSADQPPQHWASLYSHDSTGMGLARPHTMVFVGESSRGALSAFMRSGMFNVRMKVKMTVEYVGDERVAGLYCHKLKWSLPQKGGRKPNLNQYYFIWLARDRNLIPVRHQWFDPGWSEKLPGGLDYVDDLREIRRGVWFPLRTIELCFENWGSGVCENRILLRWRRDIDVTSLKFDPVVDNRLFDSVQVAAGTTVNVWDEDGSLLGTFRQPETGNLDIAPERLVKMQNAKKAKKR